MFNIDETSCCLQPTPDRSWWFEKSAEKAGWDGCKQQVTVTSCRAQSERQVVKAEESLTVRDEGPDDHQRGFRVRLVQKHASHAR